MSKTTSRAKKIQTKRQINVFCSKKKIPYKILLSSMPEISFTSI